MAALTGALAYLLAVLMFTLSFWLFGTYPAPKPTEQIESVVNPVSGHVAEQAGILRGDRILSIGGDSVDRWPSLSEAVKRHEGKEVKVELDRNGQRIAVELTLPVPGRLGVYPVYEKEDVGLSAALGKGFVAPISVVAQTAGAIFRTIMGSQTRELAGPIMMVKETSRDTFRTGELLMLYGAVMSYIAIPLSLVVAMIISLRSSEEESTPSAASAP